MRAPRENDAGHQPRPLCDDVKQWNVHPIAAWSCGGVGPSVAQDPFLPQKGRVPSSGASLSGRKSKVCRNTAAPVRYVVCVKEGGAARVTQARWALESWKSGRVWEPATARFCLFVFLRARSEPSPVSSVCVAGPIADDVAGRHRCVRAQSSTL